MTIPPTIRSGVIIRHKHTIPCPDCCGVFPVQIVTHPAEQGGQWELGMAEFGDATSLMHDVDYRREWAVRRPDPDDPRT